MRRPTRQDANADVQERVLAAHLRNHATYTEWFDEMVKVTPPKTDRRTGELKPGISESTFRGLRRVLLKRGRVTRLTTGQGSIYSVVTAAGSDAKNDTGSVAEFAVADLEPQSTAKTHLSGEDLIARAMCHARQRKRPGEA
jgi:hypothetical protein